MLRTNIKTLCNSIYFKLMLLFFIVIIPLFLLGISIYLWGYDMVKQEINQSSISQINLYKQSIEEEISRIQKLKYEFINDEDLLYLTNAFEIMDNFERSQYMLRVENRLELMKNSSKFMDSVVVHIPELGKTISSTSGVENLWENWKETITNMDQADSSGITYKNNSLIMNISHPLIIKEGKQPLIMVEITLSNKALKKILTGFNQYPDSTFLITNQSESFLLSSNSDLEINSNLINQMKAESSGTFSYSFGRTQTQITYSYMDTVDMLLVSIVPTTNILGKIQKFKVFFICFMFALILVIIVFIFFIRILIRKPFYTLINTIKEIQSGNLDVSVSYNKNDEFQYLYHSFNKMTKNLKDLIHQVYEQNLLTQKAELKQLQSQINPHFLYNSFFNIYRMAKDEDYENIVSFTQYLGTYYQYITRNAQDDVCLSAEYDNAKTYLNIQRMRFHNSLQVFIDDLPEEMKDLIVPRLIIQPVIENSFEHGLKMKENPMIRVRCKNLEDVAEIIVEDNGTFLNVKDISELEHKLHNFDLQSEITGIINIHRRLQLKFNSKGSISLSKSELGGLMVTIRVPKIKGGIYV